MKSLSFPLALGCSAALHAAFFISIPHPKSSGVHMDTGQSALDLTIIQPDQQSTEQAVRSKKQDAIKQIELKNTNAEAGDNLNKGVSQNELLLGFTKPAYPFISRINGEEGFVSLMFDINEKGKAESIKIVSSSGFERLDQSAIKAVNKAYFSSNGQLDQTLTFKFFLKDK